VLFLTHDSAIITDARRLTETGIPQNLMAVSSAMFPPGLHTQKGRIVTLEGFLNMDSIHTAHFQQQINGSRSSSAIHRRMT
jgi:hypothetical protein